MEYVVGAAVTVVAAPLALSATGFTATGIAGGSLGAKFMTWSAIASGGGVPAGGVVAGLQSAGAAGIGLVGKAALASLGALIGGRLFKFKN
ncbi:interferon alpha-inducible protein 27-like protein 2A isoform X1 [Palaemon carinicauda]|uniref:interferon alpha-inducible protein 27-like protein 2A isoform X1 n=1 Tax=Palaemon carinicauda TaxID=392227 RepID=UPI0035B5E017